jgi:hypothetical protein
LTHGSVRVNLWVDPVPVWWRFRQGMPRLPHLQEALLPAGLAPAGAIELCIPVDWPVGIAGESVALTALLGRRVYPIIAPTAALAALITMYALGPALDQPEPAALLGGIVQHWLVSGRFELDASLPIEQSGSALPGRP